jgi:hypothetical protein
VAGRLDIIYISPEKAMLLGSAFFAGLLRGRCGSAAVRNAVLLHPP